MIPRGQLGGAVLAGGRSRRMGANKARLRVGGGPLWRRQRRLLRKAGAAPVLIVQAAGQRALGRGVVRDRVRDAGPLAGLQAALEACPRPWLAVLAVDLPSIDADWFRWLAGPCRAGVGAVVRTPAGYEPLVAIYPREALPRASAQLAAGDYSLQHLVATLVRARRLRVLRAGAGRRRQLTNLNSPADLARLRSAPAGGPAPGKTPR